MIAVVDYGLGNLRSVHKALVAACVPPGSWDHNEEDGRSSVQPRARNESPENFGVLITSDPDRILTADKVVLPGVGAFAEGIARLRSRGLLEALQAVVALGKPLHRRGRLAGYPAGANTIENKRCPNKGIQATK